MQFSFSFRFDIFVDDYNSLGRNSVRSYLLFRARDNFMHADYFRGYSQLHEFGLAICPQKISDRFHLTWVLLN